MTEPPPGAYLRAHATLVVAGVVGLALFAGLYRAAFMGSTRPLPLSLDEVTARAVEFASREGIQTALARTIPLEGDDAAAVRAASGSVVDRSTLPDPAWESGILGERAGGERGAFPSKVCTIAMTPTGEVVQYIDASEVFRPTGADQKQSTQPRGLPLDEFDLGEILDAKPEERTALAERDREQLAAAVEAFFARHDMPSPGPPSTAFAVELRERKKVFHGHWERQGPAGTTDFTRCIVNGDRVVVFDRDLRAASTPPSGLTAVTIIVGVIGMIYGLSLVLVIPATVGLAIRRYRQKEIDLPGTATVAGVVFLLALTTQWASVGVVLVLAAEGGGLELLSQLQFVVMGVMSAIMLLMMVTATAFSWIVGENKAYAVWPKSHLVPMASVLRGRFRTRSLAAPTATGYLLAFVGLGLLTAVGLAGSAYSQSSTAPLTGLLASPVWIGAVAAGTYGAIMTVSIGCVFLMSYAKSLTKRTWAAVLVTTLYLTPVVFGVALPTADLADAVISLALALGLALSFARFGALPTAVAYYVFWVVVSAYPLLLLDTPDYRAAGVWTALCALAPAAVAAVGYWKPMRAIESGVPEYRRRVFERMRIEEEFGVARRVQARLLPASPPEVAGLDVAGTCVPANEVGGDYFDYFPLDDAILGIAVGDVSGKGVGAAIYMTLAKGYMLTYTSRSSDPSRVLSGVNTHLKKNMRRGSFVTMAYAVVDAAGRKLVYTRAGHNPPLLVRADGEADFLSGPGLALGTVAARTFDGLTKSETVDLRTGDLLVIYTDGVTEAMDERAEEYGEERLVALVRQLARERPTASTVLAAVLADVRAFSGSTPQHDDITVVVVRVM